MRARNVLCGVLIGAAVGSAAFGQKDQEAVGLLVAAALDAGVRRGELSSLVVAGTWTPLDALERAPRRFTVKAVAPDRVRWEMETGEGLAVTAVSGTVGWTRFRDVQRGLSVSEAAFRGAVWFPVLALAEWISSPDFRLERPVADGPGSALRRVRVVRLSDAADEDTKGALETIRRIELVTEPGRGRAVGLAFEDRSASDWRLGSEWRLEFDEFRIIDGVRIPHSITALHDGVAVQRLVLDSVQVNVLVDAGEFEP